jgi:uncharacterized protein
MRMIFVNLPVADLDRSKAFFEALGFSFNPMFTDTTAACLVIEENICAMLLTEPRFRDFITGEIARRETTECLLALSAESREAVDALCDAAAGAGAGAWKPAQDHGFMYGRSFTDPDGHVWECVWMDPEVASGERRPDEVAAGA